MNREDRISALQAVLKEGEAALLTSGIHREFYLGFSSSAGTVFVTRSSRFFVVDFRYIEVAGRIGNGFQVLLQEDLGGQLRELSTRENIRRCLLDADSLTLEETESLRELLAPAELAAEGGFTEFLRTQKEKRTKDEEEAFRQCGKIGEEVLERLRRYLVPGRTVRELRERLAVLRSSEGDESRTFDGLFSCGGIPLEEAGRVPGGAELEVSFSVCVGGVTAPVTGGLSVPAALPPVGPGRIKGLLELGEGEKTGALVTSHPDLFYYLGTDPGSGAKALILGQEILLFSHTEISLPGIRRLPPESFYSEGKRTLAQAGISSLLIERSLSLAELEKIKTFPVCLDFSGILEERVYARRAKKLPEELTRIRQAQEITDQVFSEALNFIREGMTDVEIQLLVGRLFFELGSEMLSYNHVSGCGQDTSLPHVRPSGRVARRGDFVMLDIGAKVDGYGSDMTRMIGIGAVDEEKAQIYRLVLEAQNAGIQAAVSGAICSEVDGAARRVISDRGYGEFFLHGLGHPIGCGGREGPRFNQTDHSRLAPGLVMTVEPGVYLPGKFGVRIEDMVYIGERETVNLTHSTKELICI